ncbi:hypothetical protein Tco_0189615 [Tanacetum coccineum]
MGTHSLLSVYGTERSRIPAEIRKANNSCTAKEISHPMNDERRIDLDILEESANKAAINGGKIKLKMKGYNDAKVREPSFKTRRLVEKSANDAKPRVRPQESWEPKWEETPRGYGSHFVKRSISSSVT